MGATGAITVSFKTLLSTPPRLSANGRPVDGVQTDPQRRFWRFDVSSLQPATQYELRITTLAEACSVTRGR